MYLAYLSVGGITKEDVWVVNLPRPRKIPLYGATQKTSMNINRTIGVFQSRKYKDPTVSMIPS